MLTQDSDRNVFNNSARKDPPGLCWRGAWVTAVVFKGLVCWWAVWAGFEDGVAVAHGWWGVSVEFVSRRQEDLPVSTVRDGCEGCLENIVNGAIGLSICMLQCREQISWCERNLRYKEYKECFVTGQQRFVLTMNRVTTMEQRQLLNRSCFVILR